MYKSVCTYIWHLACFQSSAYGSLTMELIRAVENHNGNPLSARVIIDRQLAGSTHRKLGC